MSLPSWLAPSLSRAEVLCILRLVGIGSAIAGAYGVAHDAITYRIGPDYFYEFKFGQFAWADRGWERAHFAMLIGFLASWWVGGFAGYFLARLAIPKLRDRPGALFSIVLRELWKIFACALVAFVLAWLAGNRWAEIDLQRVGWIHNASYGGALLGLIWAVVSLRKRIQIEAN